MKLLLSFYLCYIFTSERVEICTALKLVTIRFDTNDVFMFNFIISGVGIKTDILI